MSNRTLILSILAATTTFLAASAPLDPAHAQRRGGRTGRAAPDTAANAFAEAVRGLRLRSIGPAVVSGRIIDLAVDPKDPSTWYVGMAAGGVWKTTNAGTTFTPIFDHEGSYSIGTVVIDPNNSNVVWVGTGENNAQRAVAYGDGVYKSIDGGRTWQNMGLKGSEHIGKILIDPRNSDVVYVAAQGPVFGAGGDRGLYKTTDGGKTWTQVLSGGKWAGAGDAVMDPTNPDVLIVSLWQRGRKQWGYVAGGPESSLQRTTDGGKTWTKVQSGLPGGMLGRIGLAISPVNHDVVYAIAEAGGDPGGGFYRSQDNGVSWHRMSDESTSGLYYAELFADPTDVDRVYAVDTRLQVTDDGGRTFHSIAKSEKHVDNHVVWIDPHDSRHLLIGCDGGLYQSFDRGQTYDWFQNLPLGQFYRVAVDNSKPFFKVYGGTQDNSSVGGPSQTRTRMGAISADWVLTQGGDGFVSRIDPVDPNTVYAEAQYGALARFNLATGESTDIVPEPELGEPALRWNWDAPLIISPFSHTRLYFAAQRVFRSDDRGDSWRPISPDLTKHEIDRNKLPIMGQVWGVDALGKNSSTSPWHSIVSLAESPLKEGLIWVGTDDGMVQVTEDGGQHWRAIPHIAGVPDTTFVSHVAPSAFDTATVYASFDNHKEGDYHPYVAKSTDMGRSWKLISGDLPERGSVYVVIEDDKDPNILYAGTEFGLFVTMDDGQHWTQMRGGLPTVQVSDLTIQKRDDALAVATFGRGFYILDHLAELRALKPQVLSSEAALLPVARTPLFVPSNPDPNWQGARLWAAKNPPFGAQIHYWLKDALRTRAAERRSRELKDERAGKDVYYPSWDTLRAEDREQAPAMVLTVTDPEGRVVRQLTGPTSRGVNTVTWDLRYPSASPVTNGGGRGRGGFFFGGGGGPFVVPGTYTVSLAERVDGVSTPVGQPRKFDVYALDDGNAHHSAAVLAFQRKVQALQRAMLGANAAVGEATTRADMLQRALAETPGADPQIARDLRALQDSLHEVEVALDGDRTRAEHQEPSPPSLMSRLRNVTGGAWSSTLEGPGGEQEHQYEILSSRFGPILERLRQFVDVDLKKIEDRAEAAGAPWTSGRIPKWHQ